MRLARALFAAVALALLFFPCRAVLAGDLDAFSGLSGELVVSGSEVGLPLAMALAERVRAQHPGVSFRFSLPGVAEGYKELLRGDAALLLSDLDAEGFGPARSALRFVPMAVDPVAMAVHPSNTVSGVMSRSSRSRNAR